MVRARSHAMFNSNSYFREALWLNLPGVVHGWHPTRRLFEMMIGGVYFPADVLRDALSPSAGSAWELVELQELLCIGDGVVGDHNVTLPADNKTPVRLWTRNSIDLAGAVDWTVPELTAFCAFTLHFYAPAISRLVLPKVDVSVAVALAESLVIAEAMVCAFTRSEVWTGGLGELSALHRQACEFTARRWLESPRDHSFGDGAARGEKQQTYFEKRLGTPLTEPKVAA